MTKLSECRKVDRVEFNHVMVEAHSENKKVYGVITYDKSNWDEEYSEDSRSYEVCSSSKHFGNYISNELTGCSLDGTDMGVRLDYYKWKPEAYYIKEA